MIRHLTLASMAAGLCVATPTASAQLPTVTGSPAIADTVAVRFAGIAEATNALDFDRLLAYYEPSDDLTYVARGRVIRSHEAFSDIMDAQLRGLRGADLRWLDTYIDVLSSDLAVTTATYAFTATFPDGATVRTTGTYMCIWARRDGTWLVRYSAHSFPA